MEALVLPIALKKTDFLKVCGNGVLIDSCCFFQKVVGEFFCFPVIKYGLYCRYEGINWTFALDFGQSTAGFRSINVVSSV